MRVSSIVIHPLLCLCLGLGLTSCQKKAEEHVAEMAADAAAPTAVSTSASESDAAEASTATPIAEQLSSSVLTNTQRQFIRTVDARFEVGDVYKTSQAIEQITQQIGGFVAHSTVRADTREHAEFLSKNGKLNIQIEAYVLEADVTVRIPSAQTQDFLHQLAGQMVFLDERQLQAQDATLEYLRQKLEQTRSQQSDDDLSNQQNRPSTVAARHAYRSSRDEALLVQKDLEDRVAFSTLHLQFYQNIKIRRIEQPNFEAAVKAERPPFFYRVGQSLYTGAVAALDTIAWGVRLWPLVVLSIAIGTLIRWWRGRKRRLSAAIPHTPQE